MPEGRYRRWLVALAVVALVARLPGVWWGSNFPGGWLTHHPDEFTHVNHAQLLIDPGYDLGFEPTPYPRGTAAHVAAPWLVARVARGAIEQPAPARLPLLLLGRVIVVLYGVATVLVLAATVRLLGYNQRTALLAAAFLALGGLHVSQSHFFLADVPGLFWLLLGLYLLGRDLAKPDPLRLGWAGFAMGAAFGLKLFVIGMPSLLLAVLLGPDRIKRLTIAGIFFVAGFGIITMGSYTTHELFRTLLAGTNDPYVFPLGMGVLLYVIQWPAIVSLPIAVLGVVGAAIAIQDGLRGTSHRKWILLLVVLLPAGLHAMFVILKLDHFPRHVLPLVPWAMLLAALPLGRALNRWPGRPARWGVAAVLLYLAIFVWDGERVFRDDPRNEAAAWLDSNVNPATPIWWKTHSWVEKYRHQWFTVEQQPEVLVVQLMDANHYVNGIGWPNSYPANHENVFDEVFQRRLEALQGIFRGASPYREVARFTEGYHMPEYRFVHQLIGDRSRNYVSTVVIFRREST